MPKGKSDPPVRSPSKLHSHVVPAVTCDPAVGYCSMATPLPTASMSRLLCSAISMAERMLLPTNEGTTIPPCSTSRITVPVDGKRAGVVGPVRVSGWWAWTAWGVLSTARSRSRKAARTTPSLCSDDCASSGCADGCRVGCLCICGIECRRQGDPGGPRSNPGLWPGAQPSAIRGWQATRHHAEHGDTQAPAAPPA